MKIQQINLAGTALVVCILMPITSRAADSCNTYPLTDGISAELTDRGPKILSTATVTVDFDDQGEVLDALKEAEMTAKAQISRFFNEQIKSDDSIDKAVEKEIKIVGDQRSASKTELKKQLSSMRNSSQALLKGVIRLGDCYTKGKLVKVSVGVKPETVSSATSGQQMMQQNTSIGGKPQAPAAAGGSNNTSGFSNTDNISKF